MTELLFITERTIFRSL